jgi:hypothetical protein
MVIVHKKIWLLTNCVIETLIESFNILVIYNILFYKINNIYTSNLAWK